MSIRVRFAPSPTGNVHIGNIRVAIFNWLYARHHGGKFLLRIEDTDRERSTDEAIANLMSVMAWLGLDHDEDILYQSKRQAQHLDAAAKLEAAGHAYRDNKGGGGEALVFRIPWKAPELDCVREVGRHEIRLHHSEPLIIGPDGVTYYTVSKKGKAVENKACLAGFQHMTVFDDDENPLFVIDENIDAILAGERFEIKEATQLYYNRHEVFFEDLVKGELSKPLESMKDQVIVRSDGSPVFHLANVLDDQCQNVTHIIRGDDHVENSYRHILLMAALDIPQPAYAHLPMIVNKQGKPYSKRDGDAYVGDFRQKGFLPHALFNYLSLLGWSPGDDREKMTIDELVEAFDLDRVKSTPAQMDINKLTNLNGQYMAELAFDEFLSAVQEEIGDASWLTDLERLADVAKLMQSRTKVIPDALGWQYFFDNDFTMDEKLVNKSLRKEGVADVLGEIASLVENAEFEKLDDLESAIASLCERLELNAGKVNLPLRIAISGTNFGPGLFDIMAAIGKENTLKRLEAAIAISKEDIP